MPRTRRSRRAARADLHERFAAWLDDAGGSLGEQDEIVGYHLERAYRYRTRARSGDRTGTHELAEAAGRRLATAGEQASARSDHAAAINLLTRRARCSPPTTRCGSASCPTSGRSSSRRATADGGRRPSSTRRSSGPPPPVMTGCGCTPSSSGGWLGRRWRLHRRGGTRRPASARRVRGGRGRTRPLRAWQLLSEVRFAHGAARATPSETLERALVHARNAGDIGEQAAIYSRPRNDPRPRSHAGREGDRAMRRRSSPRRRGTARSRRRCITRWRT